MPIRITGLNSGLDTEAIISALVSSYSYKTNKYKKSTDQALLETGRMEDFKHKSLQLLYKLGQSAFL